MGGKQNTRAPGPKWQAPGPKWQAPGPERQAPGPERQAPAGNEALPTPEPLLGESALDPEAAAEMRPGETLLWTGWTSAFRKSDLLPAIFLGITCLLTVTMAVQSALSSGLLLAALGTFVATLVATAFMTDAREVRVPAAISDRRILVRLPESGDFAEQRYLDPLSVVVENETPDGTGDIQATAHHSLQGVPPLRLRGIARVREVERLLVATLIHQGGREARELWEAHAHVLAGYVRASLDSPLPEPHRKALGCLLRLEPSRLDEVVGQLGDDSDVITALGIVGMWRPLGNQGARALLRRFGGPTVRRVAACRQAMRRLCQPALRELIQVWKEVGEELPAESFSWADREALAGALAGALLADDPSNAAEVVAAVHTPALRREVVRVWLGMGDAAADGLLVLVRADGLERARWWAAEALGLGSEGDSAERLRAALAEADAGYLAIALLRAHLGDASGLATITRQLGHQDDDACQICAEALAHLGAPAVPALDALAAAVVLAARNETRQAVRRAAAEIEAAVRAAPTELEAAPAPAGSGNELAPAPAPAGRGTELEGSPGPGPHAGRARPPA